MVHTAIDCAHRMEGRSCPLLWRPHLPRLEGALISCRLEDRSHHSRQAYLSPSRVSGFLTCCFLQSWRRRSKSRTPACTDPCWPNCWRYPPPSSSYGIQVKWAWSIDLPWVQVERLMKKCMFISGEWSQEVVFALRQHRIRLRKGTLSPHSTTNPAHPSPLSCSQ